MSEVPKLPRPTRRRGSVLERRVRYAIENPEGVVTIESGTPPTAVRIAVAGTPADTRDEPLGR